MLAGNSTGPGHRTVDVDGPVHVLDFGGVGQPVVLVHGLDGSAANFWDVGPILARTHRVIAIDLPGFGRTPLAGRSPKLALQGDLALAAADLALGDDLVGHPRHLVGNSMGGPVVLHAAARHPDAVASLTLLAPAVPRAGRGPIAWSFTPFLLPFWLGAGSIESRRRMAQDAPTRVEGLLALCYAPGSTTSPEAFAEMVEVARHRDRDDAVPAWTGAAKDLFGQLTNRARFHAMADRVTCPVHVVEGAADPVIPSTSIADTLRRHPSWTHTALRGVGHAPMLESAVATADAILGNLPANAGVAKGAGTAR